MAGCDGCDDGCVFCDVDKRAILLGYDDPRHCGHHMECPAVCPCPHECGCRAPGKACSNRGVKPMNSPEKLEAGLYGKYKVSRIDGKRLTPCFVLEPAKDEAAQAALKVYADRIEFKNKTLASGIRNWLGGLDKAPNCVLPNCDNKARWVIHYRDQNGAGKQAVCEDCGPISEGQLLNLGLAISRDFLDS